jgi:cyclopropane fatty-acyl-phospholipid synthase-like methyltransferase
VDVGGGQGGLLASILERTPGLHGVVFDQAVVVEQARAALAARGLGSRAEAIGGDFFASVPEGDAHILSFVIHDWDDERAIAILRNIHRAQRDGGRVLLVEIVIPEGNEPSFGKLLDMEMLLLPGGRERTRSEYASLFEAAGFRLDRVTTTESPCSLLEAVRVS